MRLIEKIFKALSEDSLGKVSCHRSESVYLLHVESDAFCEAVPRTVRAQLSPDPCEVLTRSRLKIAAGCPIICLTAISRDGHTTTPCRGLSDCCPIVCSTVLRHTRNSCICRGLPDYCSIVCPTVRRMRSPCEHRSAFSVGCPIDCRIVI